MQNGHSDPDKLLERIRGEVQRRKLAFAPAALPPQATGVAALTLPQVATAAEPAPSAPQPVQNKPRLKRARGALERAVMKNDGVRRWPRFLRGLRRNQSAINEALIRAVGAVVETVEWLRQNFVLLERRVGDQSRRSERHAHHLAELTRQLEIRARQAEGQRQQIGRIERRIEQQARRATAEEQRRAEERKRFIEEQQKQLLELSGKLLLGERQLIELRDFINAQQRQNTENAGLLGEHQEQLTEVRGLVDESARRLEGATERILGSERTLKEMEAFVSAQQGQTVEEQAQFAQQGKKLDEVSGQLTEYQNDACARYHLTIEALEQEKRRLAEIRSRVEELKPGAFPESSPLPEIEILRDKINALQASFAIIEEHLVRADSAETIQVVAPAIKEDLKEHETDAFYLAFENQFRGSRDLIKERLRFYLPIIERVKAATGNASAVDLGCGRGEWLELLQEHGYDGLGVDLNLCMIEECRSRGLKAESADAIAYLRNLTSGSLSLVTGFHIVEHLSFSQMIDLFRETFRVLCPRGAAIFETPNPENSHVSGYSFYLDPTHRNPIPQELLCFAARQAGFEATQVERLQAYVEDGVFKGYLDYAGIFTK
jgi:O-antigen chain-terminating methyltransferase